MKQTAEFYTDGIYIKDRSGRVRILRGCNLGGDSKNPVTPPGNPLSGEVSFIGRPFPLEEADAHFSRLKSWGFFFFRLVLTWESVEHAGPGLYDEEYLSYLRDILKKAEDHGLYVWIDGHQDAWSRWTGGDGAPFWTLEAVGFDLTRIFPSGAAFSPESQGPSYIPMSWQLNTLYYAAATMFTLFFAGNALAPGRYVEGVPVQDWLQSHYIDAMKHTARRLKDCKSVIGFGTMNEPHFGFIGLRSLSAHHRIPSPAGAVPTAFQAIAAASGFTQRIQRFKLAGALMTGGKATLNEKGLSIFRDGYSCPWKEAGAWDIRDGQPVILRDDFFLGDAQRPLSFSKDCLLPFQKKFMEAFERKHPHFLFFVEGVPFEERVTWAGPESLDSKGAPYRIVEAFHWYDGLTLLFKKFRPYLAADSETRALVLGRRAVQRSFRGQLSRLAARPRAEGVPALLGEFGIPFDLDGGRAYRSGNYGVHERALGSYYDAIDANLLSSMQWNYSASNTHQRGDGWNTEDLSLWCRSTGRERALKGFCRPYAFAVAGLPLNMHFDRKKRIFTFEWQVSQDMTAEDETGLATELFIPSCWFPGGWITSFSGGDAIVVEMPEKQVVQIFVKEEGRALMQVRSLG